MSDDIDTQLIADGEALRKQLRANDEELRDCMDYLHYLYKLPYQLNIEPSTPENELGWVRTSLKGEDNPSNLERAIQEGWIPVSDETMQFHEIVGKWGLTENSFKELAENPHISFKDGFIRTKDSILCIRNKREQKVYKFWHLLFDQIHPHSYHAELKYNEETNCVELITIPNIYDKEKGQFILDLKNKETCILYPAESLSNQMPEVDEIFEPIMEEIDQIDLANYYLNE